MGLVNVANQGKRKELWVIEIHPEVIHTVAFGKQHLYLFFSFSTDHAGVTNT